MLGTRNEIPKIDLNKKHVSCEKKLNPSKPRKQYTGKDRPPRMTWKLSLVTEGGNPSYSGGQQEDHKFKDYLGWDHTHISNSNRLHISICDEMAFNKRPGS